MILTGLLPTTKSDTVIVFGVNEDSPFTVIVALESSVSIAKSILVTSFSTVKL